jgi:hypothetical protein
MDGQIGPSSSMEDLVTLRREVEAASLEGAWGCAPKGGEGRDGARDRITTGGSLRPMCNWRELEANASQPCRGGRSLLLANVYPNYWLS